MYLTRTTKYGFDADGVGADIDDIEHLMLREHTYCLKDIDENENEYSIGHCDIREIRGVYDLDYDELLEYADADSDEFIEGIDELINSKNINTSEIGKIIFISRLELDKQYRRQGIGRIFLRELIKDLTFNDSTLIILKPYPINDIVDEKTEKEYCQKHIGKIKKFYQDLHFKPIHSKSDFMYNQIL